ncbi:Kelch-type beta propeller [Lasallia pustulata]|uniref:Kelch-type beta propeller n=1 Tax=Lasallia pustulata TaxID=136370 RepID=A0A1W5D1P9_9LECA|nr:Kelch-type beta propeller [Lasallia pustulata]
MLPRSKCPKASAFKEIDVDKFSNEGGADALGGHTFYGSVDDYRKQVIGAREPFVSVVEQNAPWNERKGPGGLPHNQSDIFKTGDGSPSNTEIGTVESAAPRRAFPSMARALCGVFIVAVVLPLLHNAPLVGQAGHAMLGAKGVMRKSQSIREGPVLEEMVAKRQNSPTDICTRWSHQSAIVNGTLYVFGGRATTDIGQTNNTWNNDFVTIDLTKTWQISSPTVNGLPQPSGPPPVANGYLWNSYDSLYLYGGEYSDTPATSPVPYALWEYNIASSSWKEHSNPQTSTGNYSNAANQPVQEAAEGAGFSVPELGRGWYFGGHLDGYTTAGWSQQTARVYLKSLLEYTFPGYSNTGVQSLSSGKTAGSDGVWRNVTEGGLQDTSGFTERADGVLIYVPGFGDEGLLLGLAGGTSSKYTALNVIDVYDIATSTWYKQATSGSTPGIRVNPCAVAASAPDGSSTNVYLYGGQTLIPYGDQTQYDDMWILTIPSFTWIKVDTANQSVPPARAGHTCNIWDGQIVVVGGYVGPNISCDSPGVYVFDASKLQWQNLFTALSGGDEQNQQSGQTQGPSGLSGSYGYQVPGPVQSVVGGASTGGATVTAPAQKATEGPLATGKPITYTITGSNGATVTETSTPSSPSSPTATKQNSGPNIAAIVAGIIAGLLALLAAYLGFCAWIYRRQLLLYKNHVAMSQRAATGTDGGRAEKAGFLFPRGSSDPAGKTSTDQSSGVAASSGKASSGKASSGYTSVPGGPPLVGPVGGNSTASSSVEDLVRGVEPSFVGVLLNPRRSLRVINRD